MRRAVAADDDLLLRVVERVEGVEELGLRAFLAGEELDIVDEQHVDVAIALAEVEHALVAHRVDHLVHEALGRDVGQLQVAGGSARSARSRASGASCRDRRRRR